MRLNRWHPVPIQGIWEQVGGASTRYYTFNGQVIAMRDTSTNAVTYLHGDHLGSVSLATNSSGTVVSKQDFDPWGKARGTSTIAQTSLNYTGQRLDGTGLLYYHARYYDPALARFVSADTVVPGQADWAGTANPQDLNRYSYVNNNPVRYTDPTGHCIFGLDTIVCVAVAVGAILVGGSLVAVSSSPNSGMRMGDYDWTDWSIPGLAVETNSDTESSEQTQDASAPPPNPTGRAKNKLHPDPSAQGPHSTYKTDPQTGEVTDYETYEPNPQRPSGYDTVKRYNGKQGGDPHYNKKTGEDVQTPHVHERSTPGGVRPARPDEIPGRRGPF